MVGMIQNGRHSGVERLINSSQPTQVYIFMSEDGLGVAKRGIAIKYPANEVLPIP